MSTRDVPRLSSLTESCILAFFGWFGSPPRRMTAKLSPSDKVDDIMGLLDETPRRLHQSTTNTSYVKTSVTCPNNITGLLKGTPLTSLFKEIACAPLLLHLEQLLSGFPSRTHKVLNRLESLEAKPCMASQTSNL